MYRALFRARNAASKCAQILQNDGTLELEVQTGQERKSDVLVEGSKRPSHAGHSEKEQASRSQAVARGLHSQFLPRDAAPSCSFMCHQSH